MSQKITREAVVFQLVQAAQVLHEEDLRLKKVLKRVRESREVTPEDWEHLVVAQTVTLRIPAASLLMLSTYLEEMWRLPPAPPDLPPPDTPPPAQPPGRRSRSKKMLRRVLLAVLDKLE